MESALRPVMKTRFALSCWTPFMSFPYETSAIFKNSFLDNFLGNRLITTQPV